MLYVDLLVIEDLILNYCVLIGTSLLLNRLTSFPKLFLSSVVGTIPLIFLFTTIDKSLIFIISLLFSIIMSIIAFKYEDIIYTCDDLSKIDSNYNDILKFISTKDIITKRIAFYTLKGYNQREIGELLGIKERNINTRVYKLRNEIAKEFNINLKYNKTNGKVVAIGDNYTREFKDLNEASKELGIDKASIRKACQGLRHSAKSKILNKKLTFKWG